MVWLFLLLVLVLPLPAEATVWIFDGYKCAAGGCTLFPDAGSACQQYVGTVTGPHEGHPSQMVQNGSTRGKASYYCSDAQDGGYGTGVAAQFHQEPECPPGWDYDEVNNACEEPNPCEDLKNQLIDVNGPGGSIPGSLCLQTSRSGNSYCAFTSAPGVSMQVPALNRWYGSYLYTGDECGSPSSGANITAEKPGADWSQDGRFSMSDTEEVPENTVCSDNGDGTQTCMSTSSKTTTETLGQGEYMKGNSNSTTKYDFEGNTKSITETKTVTDDGHGNITEVVERTVTITEGNYTTNTVTNGGGASSGGGGTGLTTRSSTRTETVTDPQGNTTTNVTTSGAAGGGGGSDGTDGQVDGSGEGSGSGNGDCTGADCGDDEAPPFGGAGPGELYQPTDKTYQSVISGFQARMENSPLFAAVSGFFTISLGGSCPIWTIPGVMGMPAIVVDFQCSSTMENLWPYIAAIMIATAGFVAFRWATL